MKRIDTTQETATSWSPFKVESKAFMQDANKEMVQAICKNIISNHGLTYSATVPYLISSFTASFASDGTIFFNGELFVMRQNAGSIFAVIDTTPDTVADPTTFSDASIHNIHNNRYLTFTNTVTGSLFAMATIIDVSIKTVMPFISITPNSNFTVQNPYAGNSEPNVFQYRKNASNEIEFRGMVRIVSTAGSTIIMNLPVGSRPASGVYRPVWSDYLNTTVFISIKTGGDVGVYIGPISNGTSISLDGIRFSLDA